MVISPPTKGIIMVILGDGELLPENLNSEKVVVMRRGDSTNRELKVIKELGKLASPDLIKPPAEPVCNFEGGSNPLHEHKDGSWWFYDETWSAENGPYESFEDGSTALEAYCTTVLAMRETEIKDLTGNLESATVTSDENTELHTDNEGTSQSSD